MLNDELRKAFLARGMLFYMKKETPWGVFSLHNTNIRYREEENI